MLARSSSRWLSILGARFSPTQAEVADQMRQIERRRKKGTETGKAKKRASRLTFPAILRAVLDSMRPRDTQSEDEKGKKENPTDQAGKRASPKIPNFVDGSLHHAERERRGKGEKKCGRSPDSSRSRGGLLLLFQAGSRAVRRADHFVCLCVPQRRLGTWKRQWGFRVGALPLCSWARYPSHPCEMRNGDEGAGEPAGCSRRRPWAGRLADEIAHLE